MPDSQLPILYSFRRCPYAMRTRMTLMYSGVVCELREVLLRDKPEAMLQVSPKGTVPVLVDPDGTVRDESLVIMQWALSRNDPGKWLLPDNGDSTASMMALIDQNDGPFKFDLDRYKYSSRYQNDNDGLGVDSGKHRQAGLNWLAGLDQQLDRHPYLFGNRLSMADIAIAPFVRQFANTDPQWFESHAGTALRQWLQGIVTSDLFLSCMTKYPLWQTGETGVRFGPAH